jgi:4-hydroxybenzoate polyprenyltransferase
MTVAGLALGLWGFLLLVVMISAGLVYNIKLKRTPLSWLPYFVALPLVPTWAWVVMDEFQSELLWLYPIGALFVLAIHVSQTLPDIGADRSRGEHGISVILGRRWAEVAIWLAAFGSNLAVAAGGWLIGSRPLATTVAAVAVCAILAIAFVATRAAPERFQPHLFKILTSSAVILATGWVLAVTD